MAPLTRWVFVKCSIRPWYSLVALMAVACGSTVGQQGQNPSELSSLVAIATRVDRPPKLDGTLHDPIWQLARPITNFRQREPYEGQPATERTEVRILYTRRAVYFGVYCFERNSQTVVASQLRRDVSQELDDHFEIIIDSTHDRRNAYAFQVNPLGTQRDALITDEQRTDSSTGDGDPGWDGVWTSEARITERGWTATVGIPFAT